MTNALAVIIMFNDKPRIGVVQHLKLNEFEAAEREDESVIWVQKHKLGDKRPATLVLNRTIMDLMDRYLI